MSKLYKILLAAFIVSISFTASAQDYWTSRSDRSGITTDKLVARSTFPTEFKLFNLNIEPLKQTLFSITGNQASRHSTVISLPNADGQLEQFEVFEASNFEPALQVKYPQIRAFSGRSLTDGGSMLKLSISPSGIQTIIFRPGKQSEIIEPYSQDHTIYAVFSRSGKTGQFSWVCSTSEQQLVDGLHTQVNRIEANNGVLKTMRLAQSVTGEYSNFFGATTAGTPADEALVLTAINNTLTRCNGVFERDLAVHLNLIAGTTAVFFYDPTTDPYATVTNPLSPPGSWNQSLQTALTALIGNANYDIGHLFGASGGGGDAGCIGCVCVDPTGPVPLGKGSGITSPPTGSVNPNPASPPAGDNFDIDYVVHEMGHQMGGTHSFSFDNEGTGTNKEVGSGITIMGYAGITNQDVAPHSIDIFHAANISQIQSNLAAKPCTINTPQTGINAAPVVGAFGPFTIPISTPFALTGAATDADPADVLTYCWEQNDNASGSQTGNASVASPTKATGPNWLSFTHSSNPVRTLPRLSTILAGNSITGALPGGDAVANIEALSSVSRTLNFRLTVRDNRPYNATAVGQTGFADAVVTVSAAVGPFLITSQNSAVSYPGGTAQTVTWSVNGTTGAPTNTANVRILWSQDGGTTFPTVLVASTANDGTESVTMPAGITSTGRIKVEAIGNIYFDINNANITITPPPSGFTFDSPAPVSATCPTPATLSTTLTATFIGGHTNSIALTATATGGATVTVTPNTLTTTTTSTTVTVTNAGSLTPATYTVTVTGVSSGAPTQTRDIQFIITPATGPAITAQPVDQTVCVGNSATFSVTSPTATSFQWYVNSGAGFTLIGGATSSSYNIPAVTGAQNGNLYRVIAGTSCGSTTSGSAILNVSSNATINTHPANVIICEGANAPFSVGATSPIGTINYQWEVNNGVSWATIPGATSSTYTRTAVPLGQNGYQFRVVLTTACGTITSNPATLTVNAYPVFTLIGLPKIMCISDPSFTLQASLAGGVWSGTGVTGSTFNPVAAGVGVKTVTYTATNAGCVTPLSSTVTVNECAERHRLLSEKSAILMYPNPSNGIFSLRMNSDLYTKLSLKVFDGQGRLYMTKEFSSLAFGSVMPMDLSKLGHGTYYLYIYNSENGFVSRGDGVVIYR